MKARARWSGRGVFSDLFATAFLLLFSFFLHESNPRGRRKQARRPILMWTLGCINRVERIDVLKSCWEPFWAMNLRFRLASTFFFMIAMLFLGRQSILMPCVGRTR